MLYPPDERDRCDFSYVVRVHLASGRGDAERRRYEESGNVSCHWTDSSKIEGCAAALGPIY